MKENRPWTYQTDLYCVAATVHVMLFGEYMQVSKKFGGWEIKQKLPRYVRPNYNDHFKCSDGVSWLLFQVLEEGRVDGLFQQAVEHPGLR